MTLVSRRKSTPSKVALVWHGDRDARTTATLEKHRFSGVARALHAIGIEAQPAVYNDAFAVEVREQLLGVDGALVWVNPTEQDNDRTRLDALLRDVSDEGVFVSAHPDTILKMGTKEVLFRTREMSWGTDTDRYTTMQEFAEQFPRRLEAGKPRVLKQHRGNGGNGVWKVERHSSAPALVRVRHAVLEYLGATVFRQNHGHGVENHRGRAGKLTIDLQFSPALQRHAADLGGDDLDRGTLGLDRLANCLHDGAIGDLPAISTMREFLFHVSFLLAASARLSG